MEQPILSIVTPAYNRGQLLKNCYESLRRQSVYNFEWIIVDDGSTDDTEAVASGFQSDLFPVIYKKKVNGGKHTALNAAHELIHGRYVCILDSDDTLTPDAAAEIEAGWEKYENIPGIGIVTFLKGTDTEHPSCRAYPQDEGKPVDIMSYQREHFRSNDACEVIRTELFLKYPFPVFEGERFLSEGALWNRVSFTHKCVYINKVIYLAEYLEGGLSKSGKPLRIHNPNGGMYTANLNMNRKNLLKRRVKNGLLFTCYGCFAGLSPRQMAARCDSKLLMWLCLPFGWLLYLYWKMKYDR